MGREPECSAQVLDRGVVFVVAVLSLGLITLLVRLIGVASLKLMAGIGLDLRMTSGSKGANPTEWVCNGRCGDACSWRRAILIARVKFGAAEQAVGLNLWLGAVRPIEADATDALGWACVVGGVIVGDVDVAE